MRLFQGTACTNQTFTTVFCHGLPNTDFVLSVYPFSSDSGCWKWAWSTPDCETVLVEAWTEGDKHGARVASDIVSEWINLFPGSRYRASVSRTQKNASVSMALVPGNLLCQPLKATVPPLSECLDHKPPGPYEITLEPHARLWTTLTWIIVYMCFLFGLTNPKIWKTYPNLTVTSIAVIMASHAPLTRDLGLGWYMLTSVIACSIPLLVLAFKAVSIIRKGPAEFTLPSKETTQGVGHLVTFFSIQMAVWAVSASLGK